MPIGQAKASIGTRDIRGFYGAMEVELGKAYLKDIAMEFTSDQASEFYKWLGASPALREWVGSRNLKTLTVSDLTIINKTFEGTLYFSTDDIRRDKTGMIATRIADLARRVVGHYTKLLSLFLANGTGDTYGLCYDGQYYFDDDHEEGESGVQKNLLAAGDVAALNVGTPGPDPT